MDNDCLCGDRNDLLTRITELQAQLAEAREALTEITTLANYDVPGDHILRAIDIAENALSAK